MKKSVLELHREQEVWKNLLGKEAKILQTFALEHRQLALASVEGETLLLPIHSNHKLTLNSKAQLSLGARGKTSEGVYLHGLILTSL